MAISICLITADIFSGHTYKRAKFISAYFDLFVLGFVREGKKSDTRLLDDVPGKTVGIVSDKKYWKRIRQYVKMLNELKRKKPNYVWARGADMVLVARCYCWFFNWKALVLAEVTDVYSSSYAFWYSPLFKQVETVLYKSCHMVFATSEAYFAFYRISENKQVLWENFFPFNYNENTYQNSSNLKLLLLSQDATYNLSWTGYLRCRETLEGVASVVKDNNRHARFHIHGYPNGGDINIEYLKTLQMENSNLLYHGPYIFPEALTALFSKAHFTIVSEKGRHNMNSTLCLSNRIYESTANYTPCISVGKSAISDYITKHRLGKAFANFEELEKFLISLTPEAYATLLGEIEFEEFATYQLQCESALSHVFELLKKNMAEMAKG